MDNLNPLIPTVSEETTGHDTSTAVQTLLNDHRKIKSCLDRLENAGSAGNGPLDVVMELQALLTVHNATEENIVYPALHVIAGEQFEPRTLFHETAEADMALFKLNGIARGEIDGDFGATATKFVEAVRAHISHEEDHAFPHLTEKSENASIGAIDTAVREFRSKLRFETSPMSAQVQAP